MLLWLLKGSPELRKFILKIFLISLSLHTIVLFLLLFINSQGVLKFDIKSSNAYKVPLVFMPLTKTVKGSLKALGAAKSGKAIKTVSKNSKVIIPNFVKSKKNKKGLSKKSKIDKKALKKKIENALQSKKLEEQKILEAEKALEVMHNDKQALQKQETNLVPEGIAVGRHDLEQIEIIGAVQREINQYWRPPVGMPKDLECGVRILVDSVGKVTNLKVEKPSKSLVFDMSIKRDILKTTMPKELWSREIYLTFTPPQV